MNKHCKTFFTLLFSSLILLSSCQSSLDTDIDELSLLTQDERIELHITLADELFELYNEESNVDMETLSNGPEYFNNQNELNQFLENAKFSNSSRIAELLYEIQENTNGFIQNSDNLSENEIMDEVTFLISKKLQNIESKSRLSLSDACGDAFITGRERCQRNATISYAAVAVSGFFSLGIGTAIGAAATTAIYAVCLNDVSDDFAACRAGA